MYRQTLKRNPGITSAHVLIVDDNELSRKISEKFLEAEGFSKISFALNGSEALKILQNDYPDLIIADLFMPEMDGYQFCKKVRQIKDFEYTPIIIQTAATDHKDISKAFSSGASDVIQKPIQKEELVTKAVFHCENVLYRRRIEKELEAARKLQHSIIPSDKQITDIEDKYNIQVASYFMPSSEVGGDFWGFKKISHTELGVYAVDIAGHGVAAALNTFRVQSLLDDNNSFFSSANIFLKKLNKRMVELMPVGQFSTMFYGVINFENNKVQYSNAASPGAIIVTGKGAIEPIVVSGLPLGIDENTEYELRDAKFEKGDSLILFSDALIESADNAGNFLEMEDIHEVLVTNKKMSAENMLAALVKKFKEHVGKNFVTDDLTINIYKRL